MPRSIESQFRAHLLKMMRKARATKDKIRIAELALQFAVFEKNPPEISLQDLLGKKKP